MSDYVDENFEFEEIDERVLQAGYNIHNMQCHPMFIQKINRYGSHSQEDLTIP